MTIKFKAGMEGRANKQGDCEDGVTTNRGFLGLYGRDGRQGITRVPSAASQVSLVTERWKAGVLVEELAMVV